MLKGAGWREQKWGNTVYREEKIQHDAGRKQAVREEGRKERRKEGRKQAVTKEEKTEGRDPEACLYVMRVFELIKANSKFSSVI